MKLIRESLYDTLGFTENGDPVKDMGIGVDKLIKDWLLSHGIHEHQYRLTKEKFIIGDDTINLTSMAVEKFPEYIQFAHINGGFHCPMRGMTSLRGCPRLVQGSFFCSGNSLKNSGLIGGPQQVTGDYGASFCGLESLEGIAFKIEEDVYINDNNLHSLEFIPKEIGSLYIISNPIKTLEFFPDVIKGDLHYTASEILNYKSILKRCKVLGELRTYN